MKIRQVEAFRHVMTHGSITRAADAMALSQPAVSQLIAELERSLDFRLFVRRAGQPLQPTSEAEALFVEVSRAFVGLEELARSAREIKMLRGGHVRVVAPAFLANSIVCDATAAFLEAHVNASMTIEVKSHHDVIAMVAGKVLDVGVAVLPVDNPLIKVEPIGEYEIVCVVPQTHKLAKSRRIVLQQLRDQPLITNSNASQIDLTTESLLQASGVSITRRITARNQEIACKLVAQGVGIAIIANPLPAHIASYPGVVFRGFKPAVRIRVGLLVSSSKEPSRLVADFVERLRQSAAVQAAG
jgi:DNA-binding transcriptional LysR family regulator